MEEPIYYVRRQGRIDGPWPIAKLHSEIALRKLGRHHELSEDSTTWKRAGDLEALFPTTSLKKRVARSTGPHPTTELEKPVTAPTDDLEVVPLAEATTGQPTAWYCIVDDQQAGPFGAAELVAGIQDGRISLETAVWRDGLSDWVPILDVPEIMRQLDSSWQVTLASDVVSALADAPKDRARYSGLAVWLGIGCLFLSWLPPLGFAGVLPIIFGNLAIRDVQQSGGQLSGTGAGVTGIVLGSVSLLIAFIEIAAFGFLAWTTHS